MGLIGKFKSLMDGGGGGKLDVDNQYDMLRNSVSGTMSQFRMARDKKSGDIVGLKLLDNDKTDYFEARFKGLGKPTEGEIAVQLQHPNIVETYSHGLTTDGRRYILMEFVEGKGLNALIAAQDSVLDGNRMQLIMQMALSIEAVHQAGFIHRDICPRNFICSPDASFLKLIDFGLTLPATPEFMQPGNRTGTPQYMAPEIARRRATDHRVDIFSIGVTFYQLCAFELPWPSADMTGKVALLHDSQAPIPILDVCPTLDPMLAELIHRCIAARPEARPSDTSTLVKELARIESSQAKSESW